MLYETNFELPAELPIDETEINKKIYKHIGII